MIKKFHPELFVVDNQEALSGKPLLYSEIDIEHLRVEAYQKGFEAGLHHQFQEEKLKNMTHDYKKALDIILIIHNNIEAIIEMERNYQNNLRRSVGRITKECLDVLFPCIKEEMNAKNIAVLIEKALESLTENLSIYVRVSSKDKEQLCELLQDKAHHLSIAFEDDLPSGHCHLTWKGGGCFWEQEVVYKEINALLTSIDLLRN